MSEFTEQKELIISNLGHGDKSKIAKQCQVSRPTLDAALSRCCIADMSDVELSVWGGCLDFVKIKIRERERIERTTSKVAERL